jgi:hypothetical protein
LSIAAGVSLGQILNASIGISSSKFFQEDEPDHGQHGHDGGVVQVDQPV